MAATWVALLRGINVGRNKRIAMAGLREMLSDLGCDDVQTLLQSGNVVFRADGSAAALGKQIRGGISSTFGMDVAVLVRSAREIAAVVDANPFAAHGADPKELHVVFLSAELPAATVKAMEAESGAYAPDEFALGDRAIYLRLPNGVMGTKMPDAQKTPGVDATMRNWNTCLKLREAAAT